MELSAESLKNCCIDYISSNIEAVCTELQSESGPVLAFNNQDIFLDHVIADKILVELSDKHKLSDDAIRVFQPSVTRLNTVRIKPHWSRTSTGLMNLTPKGLSILKQHNITKLEIVVVLGCLNSDFVKLPPSVILEILNENSLHNITSLRVRLVQLGEHVQLVIEKLAQMINLRVLNLSYSDLEDQTLKQIAPVLKRVEHLDISSTSVTDISELLQIEDSLRYLSLFDLRLVGDLELVKNLRHLDLSKNHGGFEAELEDNAGVLEKVKLLPHLVSLDLSGRLIDEEQQTLRNFLLEKPDLNFIGLCFTGCCDIPMLTEKDDVNYRPHLKVTGMSTDEQLLESLRRYIDRNCYIGAILQKLFDFMEDTQFPWHREIKLLLMAMKTHIPDTLVQISGTACLNRVTEQDEDNIHPNTLGELVESLLDAMQEHPNSDEVQRNVLMTLLNGRIADDVTFNFYRCGKLLMECLCQCDDYDIESMAIEMYSDIKMKLSWEETCKISSNPEYLMKLLNFIKAKTKSGTEDYTFECALDVLWNLSDGSPKTCELIIEKEGMELMVDIYRGFETANEYGYRTSIQLAALSVMGNISEVKHLKKSFMTDQVLPILNECLHSPRPDVSYFTSWSLVHLVCGESSDWTSDQVRPEAVLTHLGRRILEWRDSHEIHVKFRTFKPIYELLRCNNPLPVQQYAVCSIEKACVDNGVAHCTILLKEGGCGIIENLQRNTDTDNLIRSMCTQILGLCASHCGYKPKQNIDQSQEICV